MQGSFRRIVSVGSGNYIYYQKSKGLSDKRINSITTFRYEVTLQLSYCGTKTRVQINGSCLKQDSVTFNHGKGVNIYIVYDINKSISDYLTLENCLFRAVRLTNNGDIAKHKYQSIQSMSRANETRHLKQHETCNCKYIPDSSVCNSKQCLNKGKFRYGCKEFIDKGISYKGFIWNPSNCGCECDKSWDVGEYLDYANCQCRKKLFDKLV